MNNGTKCASTRMILLTETNTCNEVDCPKENGKQSLLSFHEHSTCFLNFFLPHLVLMLVRGKGKNPKTYFDKTFVEYKEGFSANGESK